MPNPRKRILPPGIGFMLDHIRQEDTRGLLYYMECSADYYQLEKYVNLVTKPGCTTFLTPNLKGEQLLARNYDICHWRYNKKTDVKDSTGLIVVVHGTNKKAKYRSLGMVDGFWLDFAKGRFFQGTLSDGKTDITLMAVAPLAIMDGINDQGLGVSIMHLPTENDWQEIPYIDYVNLTAEQRSTAQVLWATGQLPDRLDAYVKKDAIAINPVDRKCWKANKNLSVHQQEPGRETLLHPVLMRRMLDFCRNVDEAVELARGVNVHSPLPDNDYHILVSDRTGASVILEWVHQKLVVQPAFHSTNYYLTRDDHYGYGQKRDDIAAACMEKYRMSGMTEELAMRTLQLASQNGMEGSDLGQTQWSSLYNLNRGTMQLALMADYSKIYEYRI